MSHANNVNMNHAHLDLGTSHYTLNLSNEEMEDKLEDQSPYSTASDFRIVLNPSLDLSPLLFLKSVAAELSVSSVSLDSLPLSTTRTENVQVYMYHPPLSANINQVFSELKVRESNKQPLEVSMVDSSTDDPQELVSMLNRLVFHEVVSSYVISKYLQLALDVEIFKSKQLTTFNKSDANLIHRYINVCLYVRHIIHDIFRDLLNQAVEDEEQRAALSNELTEDLKGKWKYEEATAAIITRPGESDAIRKSENLKPMAERDYGISSWFQWEEFYDVTLKNSNATLKSSIRTHTLEILDLQGIALTTTNTQPPKIPTNQIEEAIKMFRSNRNLIEYALLARNLMELTQNLHDKRKNPEVLFEKRIMSLVLDETKSKVSFHFAKQHFLPNDGASCQIFLPKHLSYTLGARAGKSIILGPVSLFTPDRSEPRMTETIVSDNQRLFCNVRCLPKVVNCTTDVITSKTRDMFLRKSSQFGDHHVIYSFLLTDDLITRRFIYKQEKSPSSYHRLQNVANILETFRICLLDECYEPIRFAPRTICNVSIIIRPVTFDEGL